MSLGCPLAITGVIGVAIPTSASPRTFGLNKATGEPELDIERHANVLHYGFAVEYSFIYLQEQVKDVGLHAPFDHLIPLVEFSFDTPLNRGQGGQTTGTINPGVIWSKKYFQIGAEAFIPVNSHTGSDVGFIAQLHFYLDDLFPYTFAARAPASGLQRNRPRKMLCVAARFAFPSHRIRLLRRLRILDMTSSRVTWRSRAVATAVVRRRLCGPNSD
jgi:hypothetical protein